MAPRAPAGDPESGAAKESTGLLAAARSDQISNSAPYGRRLWEVLVAFLPMGFITFGGPVSHIAVLHARFVEERQWMTEGQFLELMALGQGLPGPTSTQMITATGMFHAGLLGGIVAFFLFALPSFVITLLAGLGISTFLNDGTPDWLSGLAPAAVAIIFVAAFKITSKTNKDSNLKHCLSLLTACASVLISGDDGIPTGCIAWAFPLFLILGGLSTVVDSHLRPQLYASSTHSKESVAADNAYARVGISMAKGAALLSAWFGLLMCTFLYFPTDGPWGIFAVLYQMGSTIYGGGQVVLPLLMDTMVAGGWLTKMQFLQGFAIVSTLPGPMFNISTYLGAVYQGLPAACAAFMGLFLPGLLLISGCMPFWAKVRKISWFQVALQGVNSAAIGLIIAAVVVMWRSAITEFAHSIVFLATGCMLGVLGVNAPTSILAGGLLGYVLSPSVLDLAQKGYCTAGGP